jgi:hypothetical protein
MILLFNYASFYFKFPITVIVMHLKNGHCGLEISTIVAFNSRIFQVAYCEMKYKSETYSKKQRRIIL